MRTFFAVNVTENTTKREFKDDFVKEIYRLARELDSPQDVEHCEKELWWYVMLFLLLVLIHIFIPA